MCEGVSRIITIRVKRIVYILFGNVIGFVLRIRYIFDKSFLMFLTAGDFVYILNY